MIGLKQVEMAIVIGCVLLVFGLVPGEFDGFAERIRNELSSFQNGNLRSFHFQVHPSRPVEFRRHGWLAVIGAALIAGTLIAYFSN